MIRSFLSFNQLFPVLVPDGLGHAYHLKKLFKIASLKFQKVVVVHSRGKPLLVQGGLFLTTVFMMSHNFLSARHYFSICSAVPFFLRLCVLWPISRFSLSPSIGESPLRRIFCFSFFQYSWYWTPFLQVVALTYHRIHLLSNTTCNPEFRGAFHTS